MMEGEEQPGEAQPQPHGETTQPEAAQQPDADAPPQDDRPTGLPTKRKPGRPALHQGCQVCGVSLEGMRSFHQRYHICETHMMADGVEWKGATQRFCQQCGRFHPLDAFSGSMRSCRKQLAKHAERRRRSRELAAQAAAAAASGSDATHLQTASAAAALGFSPKPRLPGAKRLHAVAEAPAGWRLADSSISGAGSGGSSDVHHAVSEPGMDPLDALLTAAAEEDAAEEELGAGGAQEPAAEEQPGKRPRLEPDPSWFAGAAAAPPPQPTALAVPAARGAGSPQAGVGSASPAGSPADLAALMAAAQQQRQQQQALQLMALMEAQSAPAPLLLAPQLPAPPALLSMLQCGMLQQAAAPAPQDPNAALLALAVQQSLGQQQQAAAQQLQQAALVQQLQALVAAGPVPQAPVLAPAQAQRIAQREQHVSLLFQAAVDRLMLAVMQPPPLAQPLLALLQPQQLLQPPALPPPPQQAEQQQQQQQQQPPESQPPRSPPQ